MAASTIRTSVGAIVLALAVALTSCAGEAPPAPTSAPPSPSPSGETRETPTPIETEHTTTTTLPTSCDSLASDATRAEAVGDMTLQSDGEGFVRPAPEGADLVLGCDWIAGEATGMLLLISTAEPGAVTDAVGELPAEGYSCQVSDDFGADFCDVAGDGPDTEEMIVAREDVWIYLSTVGRNGRAFLSEIVEGIFG